MVIAAGGTAGHVMPALALAEALVARGARVSLIGVRGRAGSDLVARAGYPEDAVRLRGLDRRPTLGNVRALLLAAAAVPRVAPHPAPPPAPTWWSAPAATSPGRPRWPPGSRAARCC